MAITDQKLSRVSADILAENLEMQRVCKRLGFRVTRAEDGQDMRAEIALQ
jgi:acetyltransferase